VRRDVLARLLAPHAAFLSVRGFSLAALGASAQDDLAHVHALADLLAQDPDAPVALFDTLAAVATVACDAGHERLRALDRTRALPQERLGHETLAALAFLDHPALFAEVKLAAKAPATAALVEYAGASVRTLPRDPARFAALGRAMGEVFAARGRPDYCEARPTWGLRETAIDFVFGRLPQTTERLTEALARTQNVDTFTQRARAVFDHATGNLLVSGYEFMREAIRRLSGLHLLDDADHFRRVDLYSLAPLEEDLAAALAPEPDLGVTAIELREIALRRADGPLSTYAHASGLLETSVADEIRAALRAGARAEYAKLAVVMPSRPRPVRVEISPPRKLDVPRGDDALVDRVKTLLERKGFARAPVRESMVVPPGEHE
jgi:hypothetical protein